MLHQAQVKAKGNPLSLASLHYDASLMGLGYGLGNGKSKAAPPGGAGAGGIAAIKPLENLLYLIL